MTIEDKINSLIGTPYDADMYHCYTLVMELQPKAPTLDLIASKTTAVRYMNDDEYPNCVEVEKPSDLDIVLLGKKEDAYHHAGIYYKGLVIHADRPSVRAEKISEIRNTYPFIKVFTFRD